MAVPITLTILAFVSARPSGQTLPVPGTVISRTTRLPAGTYTLKSADIQHPVFVIRGSNITVDFTGVTLRGGPRTRILTRSRGSPSS